MKNNVRLNAIKQLKEGLVIINESFDKFVYDYEAISNKIEDEIFILSGNDSSAKCYRDKIRETMIKMKKSEFDSLKREVLLGTTTPKSFILNQLTNDKSISKIDLIGNKTIMHQNKKSILAPPKVKLHSRSHSTSLPQEDYSNSNGNSDVKDNLNQKEAIKDEEKRKEIKTDVRFINSKSKNKNVIQSLITSTKMNNMTQDKNSNQNDEYNLKLSNDQITLELLKSNCCPDNNESGLISSPSKEVKQFVHNVIDEKDKDIYNNIPIIPLTNDNEDTNDKDIQKERTNKVKKECELSPSSQKQHLNRHYSYSDIHSGKNDKQSLISINNHLLELQITNHKAESKCNIYQKEIESLRKELLQSKEQNLALKMKNLQLTTDLQLKTEVIAKLQKTIESQSNLLNQYDKSYSNLKSKVESNSDQLEKKMNKFMLDFTTLSNKYDKSSLSKLEESKPMQIPTSKPKKQIIKPQIDLFASNENEMTFSMLINKQKLI